MDKNGVKMSKVQILRASVQQRLTAAVEEIFGLFERTITEYEEELCRSKEENQRQKKLLDIVLKPQIRVQRAEFPADVKQLPAYKEEVLLLLPEQQQDSLDQYDPEPPYIKVEEVELPTSQMPEQLQALEGAGVHKLPITPVPLKTEDHEEKPQSSQLHQSQAEPVKTEADGEDSGGPEPASPDVPLRSSDKASQSSLKQEADEEGMETQEPPSGSNLQNNEVPEVPVKESRRTPREKRYGCIQCGKKFAYVKCLGQHLKLHMAEKSLSCPFCGKEFMHKRLLTYHMAYHTGEKPFSCTICGKEFIRKHHLTYHMASHTGEKPHSCTICGKKFVQKQHLTSHMVNHTGEKPFSCTICGKRFSVKSNLKKHTVTHTRRKLLSCTICGQQFLTQGELTQHLVMHPLKVI